ncbi:MAG: response regulator [Candidatus Korobacteraceae bacterium]|jgi:CheY-like chemotaxis protein
MILCIDDEANGLLVRKMFLQSEGHEVLTALNGPEGLALFAAHPIKIVVLDYLMPGMNGGEVAAAMKRLKPEVKILLYSAYVDLPEDAVKWADRCAVKGAAPEAFLGTVRQLLSCEKPASPAF